MLYVHHGTNVAALLEERPLPATNPCVCSLRSDPCHARAPTLTLVAHPQHASIAPAPISRLLPCARCMAPSNQISFPCVCACCACRQNRFSCFQMRLMRVLESQKQTRQTLPSSVQYSWNQERPGVISPRLVEGLNCAKQQNGDVSQQKLIVLLARTNQQKVRTLSAQTRRATRSANPLCADRVTKNTPSRRRQSLFSAIFRGQHQIHFEGT